MTVVETFVNKIKKYIDFDSVKTIYDVGAGDCAESVEMTEVFKNAHVYAFEANPVCIYDCAKMIVNNPRVTLFPICVNDHNGIVEFHPINQQLTKTTHPDGNPKASSLFVANGTYPIEEYVQDKLMLPCMRLSSVMEMFELSMPDIIWMDLQGAELYALKGFYPYIRYVRAVHSEIWGKETYTGQSLFPEMKNMMKSLGFVCEHEPLPENWIWADAEFIRKDIWDKVNSTEGGSNG